ncbi:Glycine cleavage system H protein [hydrothermal vent metagenome]|uniref:Glycine cleavage system H protein n=1 Tax=hydrothermal vent metagenome TaxID=652676 RepID=A0A3B1CWJ4_9ZZZZ
MKFPDDLYYTKDHEWARIEGDIATVGITDFAQGELGDVVFVELPEQGKALNSEESFAVVESVKTVSDLYSPFSGEVTEVNTGLEDQPELVNQSPYEKGWIIRLKLSNPSETGKLMNAADYQNMIKKGG